MSKALLILVHPTLEKSRVNRELVEMAKPLEGIHVHDLYEKYPDFHIDVEAEQKLLLEHELIIWQHPFYWYSSPALLKEWFDLVLEFGWAYGSGGEALRGKKVQSIVTTGGSAEAYCPEGSNAHSVEELLLPFERTAVMCQMEYLKPKVYYSAMNLSGESLDEVKEDYRDLLRELVRGLKPEAAGSAA